MKIKYLEEHKDEFSEDYIRQKAKQIDVDIDGIIYERRAKEIYDKKVQELTEQEGKKWEALRKFKEDQQRKKLDLNP